MGEIVEYRCPRCGRSFEEMRGALMSDMGPEPAERRERRRLFMRGPRDRLHGIKRAPSEAVAVGDEWLVGLGVEELTCRRCGVEMEPGMRLLVD
jgi:DNA-directed RNA polymerase subunit RPC12/RpoP